MAQPKTFQVPGQDKQLTLMDQMTQAQPLPTTVQKQPSVPSVESQPFKEPYINQPQQLSLMDTMTKTQFANPMAMSTNPAFKMAPAGGLQSGGKIEFPEDATKVPTKTGNPNLDRGIKSADAQGTNIKKLESMWDKAAKFFMGGGAPEDVTIWDFLEATGRAMANDRSESTRSKRLGQAREDKLIAADLAAKQADAQKEQQDRMALQQASDQAAMARLMAQLQAQQQSKQMVSPYQIGAGIMAGGQ